MPHFSEVVELLESEWFASLSSGQQSVLAGTLFGVEDEEIAKSLNRTSRTVRTYRKEVEDSLCVYLDLKATSSDQLDKDHAE
jgi:DNA-binding NarL/FixJ family response regulator